MRQAMLRYWDVDGRKNSFEIAVLELFVYICAANTGRKKNGKERKISGAF
jgi:hypothetical protein